MSKPNSSFLPNDIVWAKMRGYPHWPAKVLPNPPGHKPSSCFVFFYGTHQVAWMASKDLLPYQKYREKFRHCGRSGLKDAAWEAEEDPNLELSEDRAVLMKYETPGRKTKRKKRSTPQNQSGDEACTKKIKTEIVTDEESSSNPATDEGGQKRKHQQKPDASSTEQQQETPSTSTRRSTRLRQPTLSYFSNALKKPETPQQAVMNPKRVKKEALTESSQEEDEVAEKKESMVGHGYSTRNKKQKQEKGSGSRQTNKSGPRRRGRGRKSTKSVQNSDQTEEKDEKQEGQEKDGGTETSMSQEETTGTSQLSEETTSINGGEETTAAVEDTNHAQSVSAALEDSCLDGESDGRPSEINNNCSELIEPAKDPQITTTEEKQQGENKLENPPNTTEWETGMDTCQPEVIAQEDPTCPSGKEDNLTATSGETRDQTNEPNKGTVPEQNGKGSIEGEDTCDTLAGGMKRVVDEEAEGTKTEESTVGRVPVVPADNTASVSISNSGDDTGQTTTSDGQTKGEAKGPVALASSVYNEGEMEVDSVTVHDNITERLSSNGSGDDATRAGSCNNATLPGSSTVESDINIEGSGEDMTQENKEVIVASIIQEICDSVAMRVDPTPEEDQPVEGTLPLSNGLLPDTDKDHPSSSCSPATEGNANSDQKSAPEKKVPPLPEVAKLIPITGPPIPPKPPVKKKRRHPPKQLPIMATMCMVDALKAYNYNLKICLVVDYLDTTQALRHLRDLLDLSFTASDIEEVKDLVFTLRKLRRFKNNSRIRNRADELYSKIKALYVIGEVRPNPKIKKDNHKPQTVVRLINEAAAAAKQNGNHSSDKEATSDEASVSKTPKEDTKEEPIRRSQRSRNRVNYSELSGEVPDKAEDQEVPSS